MTISEIKKIKDGVNGNLADIDLRLAIIDNLTHQRKESHADLGDLTD